MYRDKIYWIFFIIHGARRYRKNKIALISEDTQLHRTIFNDESDGNDQFLDGE